MVGFENRAQFILVGHGLILVRVWFAEMVTYMKVRGIVTALLLCDGKSNHVDTGSRSSMIPLLSLSRDSMKERALMIVDGRRTLRR